LIQHSILHDPNDPFFPVVTAQRRKKVKNLVFFLLPIFAKSILTQKIFFDSHFLVKTQVPKIKKHPTLFRR